MRIVSLITAHILDGVGYDGRPSAPVGGGLPFDLDALSWQSVPLSMPPSVAHRPPIGTRARWSMRGGMLAGQRVIGEVAIYTFK